MENIFDKKITIYRGVTDNKGTIATLADFLEMGEAFKEQIAEIRAATGKEQKALKHKIQCAATISGVFEPTRKKENLKEHSGLICIDIDIKENENAQWNAGSVMDLLRQMDIITYASRSIGGNGVFAFVPLAYPERHEEQFAALYLVFKEQYDLELDTSCKDASHLRFVSYDPEAFWRPDAKAWEGVWSEPTPQPMPVKKHHAPSTSSGWQTRNTSTPFDDLTNAEKCVRGLERRGGASFLNDYDSWLENVAMPFASIGEAGREFFHRVSSLAPEKYDPSEDDKKFTSLIGNVKGITIATFFKACEGEGIYYKDEPLSLAEWKQRYPNQM